MQLVVYRCCDHDIISNNKIKIIDGLIISKNVFTLIIKKIKNFKAKKNFILIF